MSTFRKTKLHLSWPRYSILLCLFNRSTDFHQIITRNREIYFKLIVACKSKRYERYSIKMLWKSLERLKRNSKNKYVGQDGCHFVSCHIGITAGSYKLEIYFKIFGEIWRKLAERLKRYLLLSAGFVSWRHQHPHPSQDSSPTVSIVCCSFQLDTS